MHQFCCGNALCRGNNTQLEAWCHQPPSMTQRVAIIRKDYPMLPLNVWMTSSDNYTMSGWWHARKWCGWCMVQEHWLALRPFRFHNMLNIEFRASTLPCMARQIQPKYY